MTIIALIVNILDITEQLRMEQDMRMTLYYSNVMTIVVKNFVVRYLLLIINNFNNL